MNCKIRFFQVVLVAGIAGCGESFPEPSPAVSGSGESCVDETGSNAWFSEPSTTEGNDHPFSLCVRDGAVYWGGILQLQKQDFSGRTPLLAWDWSTDWSKLPQNFISLAVDDENVYFLTIPKAGYPHYVSRIPKNGGTVVPLTNSYGEAPSALTLDGDYLYIAFIGFNDLPFKGSIWKVHKMTGDFSILVGYPDYENRPTSIATDANRVYWTNDGWGVGSGAVRAIDKEGGAPVTLADGLTHPSNLQIERGRLFWTENAGTGLSRIGSLATSGGAASTVVGGLENPSALIVTPDRFCWAESTGTIRSFHRTDGCRRTLVAGLVRPEALAVDGDNLYYVDRVMNRLGCVAMTRKIESPPPQELAWRLEKPIPYPVWYPAVAADGSKIYVAGGGDHWGARADLQIYDTATSTWSFGPPMPVDLSGSAYAVLDGKLYVVGGWNWHGAERTQPNAFAYDLALGTWSVLPNLPFSRGFASAFPWNGKLYVIGGESSDQPSNPFLTDVTVYDPVQNRWSEAAPMPAPHFIHSGVRVGDHYYIVGGSQPDSNLTDAVWAWNLTSDTWTQIASLPHPREGFALSAVGNRLLVAGGLIYPDDDRSLWYDPDTNGWTPTTRTPIATSEGATGVRVGNRLYVFSGQPDVQSVKVAD